MAPKEDETAARQGKNYIEAVWVPDRVMLGFAEGKMGGKRAEFCTLSSPGDAPSWLSRWLAIPKCPLVIFLGSLKVHSACSGFCNLRQIPPVYNRCCLSG